MNEQAEKELRNTLKSAGNEIKKDAGGKAVFMNPFFLARLLKFSVKEFKDYDVDDIAQNMIDSTSISESVPVGRNLTNFTPEPEEDTSINEGNVRYDTRFRVTLPGTGAKAAVTLHFNIEAQKSHTSYPIEKRGEYYCARMLSSQMKTLSENMDYGVLEKVFSIWICFDVPKRDQNTVSRYTFQKEDIVGKYDRIEKADYDLMEVIIIRLAKDTKEVGADILDFLHIIFGEITLSEKVSKLRRFGMSTAEEREVSAMNGFGEFFMERGLRKGMEQGIEQGISKAQSDIIKNMHANGMDEDDIAKMSGIELIRVKEILGS